MSLSRNSWALGVATVIAMVFLAPTMGFGQSSISGVARDESGAVLPGVTVEAASPALIEKVRVVTTDNQGVYRIVDLRPGIYTVTFSLQGFNTFRREGITLEANATATVNGDMKVGAIEESITVTGEASIVDVQNSTKQQVLNRDLLDALPTGRQIQTIGFVLPGVTLSSPDVGGSGGLNQRGMGVHGTTNVQSTIQVDGMLMNTYINNGGTQQYFNNDAAEEMTFQTSGVSAEVSGGGLRLNMIPKEGGNTFSGHFLGVMVPNDKFQANNHSDELRQRGLGRQNRVTHVHDVNASFGGPIRRDVLWFFSSYRNLGSHLAVADVFYPDGRQAINDNWLSQGMTRLTWRPHTKHKIAGYYDLTKKETGHEQLQRGIEERAAVRRPADGLFYVMAQAKWTGTLSNKLLVESGLALSNVSYSVEYMPGVARARGTPEWYTMVSRQDTILGTRRIASNPQQWRYPIRNTWTSAVTYVTGSHAVKVGLQWGFGVFRQTHDANGDLVQVYRNGVPDSVTVYNTPVDHVGRVKADLGVYAQDSWTIKRMTINAGLRYEYFNSYVDDQAAPAGRFVPLRNFAKIQGPIFHDLTPRFGVSYDVLGDGKTAVKGSVGKYVHQLSTDFVNQYNPMFLASDSRRWNDLNGDDVAQDNEIGPSNNRLFGIRPTRRWADEFKREYNVEYAVSIQRQLMQSLSASVGAYRRSFHRLHEQDNLLVSPADYTPVNIISPLNGEQVTVYNLNPTKQGLVDIRDVNSDGHTRADSYRGIELTVEVRTPGRGRIFGGITRDRMVARSCSLDDPNNPLPTGAPAATTPIGRFCDETTLDIPFRNQFKLSGSYPVPLGVLVSGAFTSQPGTRQNTNYSVGRGIVPGLTQTSVIVPLAPPGSKFLKQWNQLDLSLARVFNLAAGRSYRLQVDFFNALNTNVVMMQGQTWGSELDRPTEILTGRLLRIGGQFHF